METTQEQPAKLFIESAYAHNKGFRESFLIEPDGIEYLHPLDARENVRLQWSDILLAEYLLKTKSEHNWVSWESFSTY